MSKKKPGPKTRLGKTNQSVTIFYPPELIAAIDKIAQNRRISRTALMRDILVEYLEKNNPIK